MKKQNEYEAVSHDFDPVFDENSQVLILGTFPSVKSREHHFYYGHPQNRFWKVIARLTDSEVPQSIAEKRAFAAAWDCNMGCH